MRLRLVAVGRRVPDWAAAAYREYTTRIPADLRLELVEVPSGRKDEGARILAHVPNNAHAVALDGRGTPWNTRELAAELARWRERAAPVALIVGGADGLDAACRARADQTWSLSPLTLPHMLVRVVLAEQLYRASTILAGHPYHRD